MIMLMESNEEITTTNNYYVPIYFVWKSFLLILFCKVYTIMWTQYKYAINHYERKDTTVSSKSAPYDFKQKTNKHTMMTKYK